MIKPKLPLKWFDSKEQDNEQIILWNEDDILSGVKLDGSIAKILVESENSLVILEGSASVYTLDRTDHVTFIEGSVTIFDDFELDMKCYYECSLSNHNRKVVCCEDDLRKFFPKLIIIICKLFKIRSPGE